MIAPDPAQRFSSYDELVSEMEHAQHALKDREHVAVGHGRRPRWALAGIVVFIMFLATAALFLARKPRTHVTTSALPSASVASVKLNAKDKSPTHGRVNPQPAGVATRAENEKKVLAFESAPWNAALANYREQIALYDFAAAREAIKDVQLSDASLKQAQETTEKRAQWLIDWKNNLIGDINRTHFSGAISDSSGAKYTGIAGATDQSLSLKLRYGIARVTWRELSPKTLLMVSTSFAKPNAPDTPDRQWRCAVFASEFGQTEVARQLAEAAAKVNYQYHEQISQLFPSPPQFR